MNYRIISTAYIFILATFPALVAAQSEKLLFSEDGKQSAYPRLSHDNGRILYQSNRSGKWQLSVLEIGTNKQTQLTNDNSNNNLADWSPDNQSIAFVSDRDGNEEIYLMKSDSTGLRRLTDNPARDIHPYFSPDGKYILFNSDRGNGSFDIYRITIDGDKIERITDTPENETCAHYSPDMKQIVFLRNSERFDDLFTMSLLNGLTSNISKTPRTTDGWPMYSPDGQWIYFSSMESGIYSIYRMKSDGSEKSQITYPKPGEEDARICISSTNDFFIYNKKIGETIAIYQGLLKG